MPSVKFEKSFSSSINNISNSILKTWERIQNRYKSITIDGVNYNYISHVIDHFSSFNIIWALALKIAEEVVLGSRIRVILVYQKYFIQIMEPNLKISL
jgi:hypothetical protein